MRPISAEAREARTWTSVDQLSVRHAAQVLGLMVPRGLEPRTLRLLAVRSDQLSYETCVKGRQPKSNLPVLHWPGISLDSICISLARLSDPHGPMQNTVQHPSTVVTPAHHEDVWSHAGLNRGPYGY